MYLLAQLKSQGLSRDALHVIFTATVLSVITFALPPFAGQCPPWVYFGKLLGVDFVAKSLVLTSSHRLEIKKYFAICQMIDTVSYMHCFPNKDIIKY